MSRPLVGHVGEIEGDDFVVGGNGIVESFGFVEGVSLFFRGECLSLRGAFRFFFGVEFDIVVFVIGLPSFLRRTNFKDSVSILTNMINDQSYRV